MLEIIGNASGSQSNFKGVKDYVVRTLVCGTVLLFLAQASNASPFINSFNYRFKTAVTNSGVEPSARGTVSGTLAQRGAADTQKLTVTVSKLQANTTYHIVAFLADSVDPTAVADFTTDKKGGANVAFLKSARTVPHPLPDAINPISNIRELDVVDVGGATILQTDISDPTTFSYALKRVMNITGITPSAGGSLTLSGTARSTKVSVAASGLVPSASYQLLVNGATVTTKTADGRGRLGITGPKTGLPLAQDIKEVAISDGTNNILISTGLGIPGIISTATQGPVALGAAGNYAILAGSTITSIHATTVNGNIGLSPGSAVTGFPPGIVNGRIDAANPAAAQAKAALTVAYNDAKGRTTAPITVAGNLGGQTLAPGLYKSTGSLEISSGDLTLDGGGDVNAVWIFQIATTLTTTSDRKVFLIGNAQAANVFWQVGTSATLGTTSVFKGTIMADQAITLDTGATLDGRALARIAAVTMDGNTVTAPGH